MNNFITLLTQTQDEIKVNLTEYIQSKGYTNVIDTEDAVAFISPKENQPCLWLTWTLLTLAGQEIAQEQNTMATTVVLEEKQNKKLPHKLKIFL